jgi:hypothetical protein
VCKKKLNGCNCLDLDDDELRAAATELRTLANDATKAGQDFVVISVGGKQSDLYVKQAALTQPCFVGGSHASTLAVCYPFTWVKRGAQIAASHKCVNAMGEFMYNNKFTKSSDTLLFNMQAAPLVGMVQGGTKQEVLDKATAADFAASSKRGTKICYKLHEKKNADGKSLHAAKMLSKRKYSGQADKDTANYKCPNLYFYATPREKNGQKRKHQHCGDKSQVLVPYHAELVACTD